MIKSAAEREQIIGERKRGTERLARLWVRDQWRDFEIVEVPVEALLLNVDNRRFRAERMWAEEKLGRSLDPENVPDDVRNVESLLLDSAHRVDDQRIVGTPSDDTDALQRDWQRRKQESPFWIRPDGTVRNGNRRLAMIQRLQRDGGDTGLQWAQAVILDPADIDEPALLEMEQQEQLTENFKVRYNDIDYLLALRDAASNRDIDWFERESIEEVAGELQSMVEKSEGEVLRDLYAIKYMDRFLEDCGQGGQYHRLLRTLERFRDIGRMMMRVEQEYALEADRVLQVLFAAVRTGTTHIDIRTVRRMFRADRERFDKLALEIEQAEDSWDQGAPTLESALVTDTEATDEDEDEEEGPGPQVANYPKNKVSEAISSAIDAFVAGQGDTIRVIGEILNRLDVLDRGDKLRNALSTGGDSADAIRRDLSAIAAWVDQHRDLLES